MKRVRVTIHLVTGEEVTGDWNEASPEDITELQDFMKEVMKSSTEGWQVNLEMPNNGWAIFPRQSVLWVEMEINETN